MNYIISGTGLQKFQVCGVAHGAYVKETPSYIPDNTTKYNDYLVHPVTGEFAFGLNSTEDLPAEYSSFIVDDQYLIDNGFKQSQVEGE